MLLDERIVCHVPRGVNVKKSWAGDRLTEGCECACVAVTILLGDDVVLTTPLSHHALLSNPRQPSHIHPKSAEPGSYHVAAELEIRITWWRVLLMVFQTVQVLVPLATYFAFVRLLLLHAERTGIWSRGLGIHNGECAVAVFVKLLGLVTVSLVVPSGIVSIVRDPECKIRVGSTYFRPFWFLYAFSHPMTGHLKGLFSSPAINMAAAACWGVMPFITISCCCLYARIKSLLLLNWPFWPNPN